MEDGLKILLVDDNAVNLTLLKKLLKEEGAELYSALNGEEAV